MRVFIIFILFLCTHWTTASYPRAENVTWRSINFKTMLTWGPKPSKDYSYTVEYSAMNENKQRTFPCTRSSSPECDLSSLLTNISSCYTADVISEPPLGMTSDLIGSEGPHTTSPTFCPYKDTFIGRPDFRLQVSEDKRRTTLFVSDPLTALFKDGRQLTIRDVFNEQLQYKVTYRRSKSTGTKVEVSKTNEIQLKDLDQGESYCFSVQAFIPSRTTTLLQHGAMSKPQCSNDQDPSIFKVYSLGVIAGAIFLALLLIGIIIIIIIVCCKHRKKQEKGGKEGVPLHHV